MQSVSLVVQIGACVGVYVYTVIISCGVCYGVVQCGVLLCDVVW